MDWLKPKLNPLPIGQLPPPHDVLGNLLLLQLDPSTRSTLQRSLDSCAIKPFSKVHGRQV